MEKKRPGLTGSITHRIGRTNYTVKIHFYRETKENLQTITLRMIQNDTTIMTQIKIAQK